MPGDPNPLKHRSENCKSSKREGEGKVETKTGTRRQRENKIKKERILKTQTK
jgi:hypothetical protein